MTYTRSALYKIINLNVSKDTFFWLIYSDLESLKKQQMSALWYAEISTKNQRKTTKTNLKFKRLSKHIKLKVNEVNE